MYGKIQKIHFVGIGGIGMSGIAEVLINLGYDVSGSDLKESEITRRLATLGGSIAYGHRAENLTDVDVEEARELLGVTRRLDHDREELLGRQAQQRAGLLLERSPTSRSQVDADSLGEPDRQGNDRHERRLAAQLAQRLVMASHARDQLRRQAPALGQGRADVGVGVAQVLALLLDLLALTDPQAVLDASGYSPLP